jgi:hypothetical protein
MNAIQERRLRQFPSLVQLVFSFLSFLPLVYFTHYIYNNSTTGDSFVVFGSKKSHNHMKSFRTTMA